MPPFVPPLADPSKVNPSLSAERALVSFNVDSLSQFLHGGNHDKIRRIRGQIEQDPVFSNADKPFLSRERLYVRSLEKAAKLVEMRRKNNWNEEEMMTGMMLVGDSTPQFLVWFNWEGNVRWSGLAVRYLPFTFDAYSTKPCSSQPSNRNSQTSSKRSGSQGMFITILNVHPGDMNKCI